MATETLFANGGNTKNVEFCIRHWIGAESKIFSGLIGRSITVGVAMISLLAASLVAWGQKPSIVPEANQLSATRDDAGLEPENPAEGQETGALRGRITLEGVRPILPKLRVPSPTSPRLSMRATEEQRKDYEASLVEIDDESLLTDNDQGLANAFVYLAKAPSKWQQIKMDLKPFTLAIQDYRFQPRAAIVRTGQDVRLNNSRMDADSFAFAPIQNDAQNRAVNAGSEITLEHPFTSPERIPVQANSHIHPWKTAFLLPLDHPFAAITDSHGNFSIEGLPPGEHPILVWHERFGWLKKSLVVNIEAGKTMEVHRSFDVDRLRPLASQSSTNSNWITAPQICVGKAYSETAKAVHWKWDQEQKALLATPETGEMLASCLPGVAADFVVTVRLKFLEEAQCRLIVGEMTFDFTKSPQRTKLQIGETEHTFRNDDNVGEWTLFQVQRRNHLLSVRINEQPSVELGRIADAIPKISLQSTRGTIAVNNFVVTGNVHKINQAQAAPNNGVLLLPDTISSNNDKQSSDDK